ncbi:hypothetical protein [Pelagicoccus sp. SDUM812002]|uniref:hypothetical protein n=1 Tax=Pelagicoccus sp. SDUM812002 TaxID=3041266 RepID=UPI00280D435D|nr:hypothetical protein [Pelagicoccus sp. SDUM812002]MDQ8188572.1 hypothetical protein [Pelagicoccus sp. SDUM812002]
MTTLIASPRKPSGYTWTIASRISDALAEAEQRFGKRDPNFFYAGHEFVKGNPSTWYPGDRGHIIIQLGERCIDDSVQAIYQLSHEVIHLLAPTNGKNANNLEEGLATHFSQEYCFRATGRMLNASLPCYRKAGELVQRILNDNPNCIKSMRHEEKEFSKITEEIFSRHCSCISEEEKRFLLGEFSRSELSSRAAFDQSQYNGEQGACHNAGKPAS